MPASRARGSAPPCAASRASTPTVSRTTSAAAARNVPVARCSSPDPPRGQARSPISTPIPAPITTSTIRASASRQSTGDTCAKTNAITSVNSACAQPGPSSGPAAKPTSMITGSAIAYTVGGRPTTSSAAATSAPAVVPTNAGRSVERVSAAEVRRRVSTVSSTQKPCDRSNTPASSRATASASASRSAPWK